MRFLKNKKKRDDSLPEATRKRINRIEQIKSRSLSQIFLLHFHVAQLKRTMNLFCL